MQIAGIMSRKRHSDCLQADNTKGNMLEATETPSLYLEAKFDYVVHILTECFIYKICKLILLNRFNISIQTTKEVIGKSFNL